MPDSAKQGATPKKQESFLGNLMKYSVATYLGFLISGAALIVKGILPPDSYAVPAAFMAYTTSLMNVGMLGLDQGLLRFYHEPPEGATGRTMFAACTRLSLLVMAAVGLVGSVFFAGPLATAFGLGAGGAVLVPFLFLNAALYMLVRYLNVLLRLENNVKAYTAETLWMQACLNLLFLLPGFFTHRTWVFIAAAVGELRLRGRRVLVQGQSAAESPCPALQNRLPPDGALQHRAGPGRRADAAVPERGAFLPCVLQRRDRAGAVLVRLPAFAAGHDGAGRFSTYWGPYVYAHYRTEQARIGRIHDLLNFLIFGFFCCLVMFEDIIFLVFPGKAACQRFFR